MRLFLKILAGVVGLLVIVLVGAFAYVTTVDLNDYKADIEAQVEQATGRSFSIGGPIESDIGLQTSVKVTDITLGNADWGSRPEMVTVQSFEVAVDLLSFLDTPDVMKLHLTGVDALIETDVQGRQNTQMGPPGEPGAPTEQTDDRRDHRDGPGDIVIPILRDVMISDITVTLMDATSGETHTFVLEEFALSSNDPNASIPLSLRAAFDSIPIVLDGALGKPSAITSSEPWDLDIKGDIAGLALDIGGAIREPASMEGVDIAVSVKSDEIGALSPIVEQFAGQKIPALGPMDLGLKLAGDLDGALAVQDLAFALGKSDLIEVTATGVVANAPKASGIAIDITVTSDEVGALSPIAEDFAGQKVPALGPLNVALKVAGGLRDGIVVNGLSVDLGKADLLKVDVSGGIANALQQEGIDLAITVVSPEVGDLSPIVKEVAGQEVPALGPLDLDLSVKGGVQSKLSVEKLNLALGKADLLKVDVSGGIADALQQDGIDLAITVVSPEVGNLSPIVKDATGQEVPALGPLDLGLSVKGGLQSKLSMENLNLALGKAESLLVAANGRLDDVMKASGADLGFSVDSPNLSVLSKLAGSPVPPIGPVDIDGTVKGNAGEPITIDPFTAKIANSDIGGTATIDATGEVLGVVARFSSTYFDTNDVSPTAEDGAASGGSSSGTASGSGDAGGGDGKMIPADPLPLDALKTINADIEYKAQRFIGAVAELNDLDIKLKLENGDLKIDPLDAKVGAGTLDGSISLGGSQATPPLDISIVGKRMDMAALLAGAGFRDKIEGPIDMDIGLKGAGNNPRAIASSLNGRSQVSLYDSRILKKAFEEKLGGTLAGILASEGGWIVIDCMVFDYPTVNGVMETKAGYIASGPVTVTTTGEISLVEETVDLKIKPKGGGLVSLPLIATGPFNNVSVIPDPVSVGVGVLAGVLTGGLAPALLATVGSFPEGHPCQEAVEKSAEAAESAGSAPAAAPATAVEEAGKAIEEGVGGALNKLFGN